MPGRHLSGYRDSGPVRIGNGAAFHQQFDIYGELMDGIYLYNRLGKPVTWEQWVAVREILGMFSGSQQNEVLTISRLCDENLQGYELYLLLVGQANIS